MTGANSGMAASQGWIKILRDLGAFSSGRLFYMPCKLFILRRFVPDLWRPLARLSSTVASEREVISGQIARQRSELLDGLVQGGCLRLFAASTAALSAPLAAVPTLAAVTTAPHPDAALLALGERFDQAHREWASNRDAYEAANEAWGAALQNLARTRGSEPVPDEVYFRLFAEADPDGLLQQEQEFCETRIP
jgi:hypothetical protein